MAGSIKKKLPQSRRVRMTREAKAAYPAKLYQEHTVGAERVVTLHSFVGD